MRVEFCDAPLGRKLCIEYAHVFIVFLAEYHPPCRVHCIPSSGITDLIVGQKLITNLLRVVRGRTLVPTDGRRVVAATLV
jgi:hypothetical protein